MNSASSQPAGREQALALKLLYLSVFVLRCRAGDPPAPRQHGGVSRPRAGTASRQTTSKLSPPSLSLVGVGAARALGGTPPPSELRTTIGRKTLARVASVERAHTQPLSPPSLATTPVAMGPSGGARPPPVHAAPVVGEDVGAPL